MEHSPDRETGVLAKRIEATSPASDGCFVVASHPDLIPRKLQVQEKACLGTFRETRMWPPALGHCKKGIHLSVLLAILSHLGPYQCPTSDQTGGYGSRGNAAPSTSGHRSGARSSKSPLQHPKSATTGAPGNSRKKRKQEDGPPGPKSQRPKGSDKDDKGFACPFYLYDKFLYHTCGKHVFVRGFADTKQHVERVHQQQLHCPTCGTPFSGATAYENRATHQLALSCTRIQFEPLPGVTPDQAQAIRLIPNRNGSPREKWCLMWSILFPTCPPPADPYLSNSISFEIRTMHDIRDHFNAQPPQFNHWMLTSASPADLQSVLSELCEHIIATYRALDNMHLPVAQEQNEPRTVGQPSSADAASPSSALSMQGVAFPDTYTTLQSGQYPQQNSIIPEQPWHLTPAPPAEQQHSYHHSLVLQNFDMQGLHMSPPLQLEQRDTQGMQASDHLLTMADIQPTPPMDYGLSLLAQSISGFPEENNEHDDDPAPQS